jgi:hypothetical protein
MNWSTTSRATITRVACTHSASRGRWPGRGSQRESTRSDRQPALDPPVELADPGGGRGGLLAVAEDDRQGGVQHRAKAAQRVVPEAAVGGHPGGDQRVGKLQQHRGWGAQQQQPLTPDLPDHRAGPNQPGSPAIPSDSRSASSRGRLGLLHGRRAGRAGLGDDGLGGAPTRKACSPARRSSGSVVAPRRRRLPVAMTGLRGGHDDPIIGAKGATRARRPDPTVAADWQQRPAAANANPVSGASRASGQIACLAIRSRRMRLDHLDDHPDDPSVSVWSRLTGAV